MEANRKADLSFQTLLTKVLSGFTSLSNSPRELYKAYVLKFLDSYSYFSFSIIFTLFLSEDFGFSDVAAGSVYGAWGALVTIYGLISGVIVDNMGVALSLRVGFLLSLVSRIAIFATCSKRVLLWNVCVFLPMGNCLGIPVLTTGIRRYTTEQNRGFAFGLFYVIMNLAALFSGPVVDMCTILYKDGTDDDSNHADHADDDVQHEQMNDEDANDDDVPMEWSLTGYRIVVLTGIVANVIACLVTLTIREIKIDTTTTNNANNNTSSSSSGVSTFQPLRGTPTQILRETLSTPSFWRFLAVCMITLNIRMIFRHLDATLPKYMVREFGPNTPKGTIYSINPALIIILVPLVQAATNDVDPLVMIHYGIYISAASVFFLVVSTTVTACALFVIMLSIGEAVWSPRLYDYTMSVTKEGREGTYMALSSAPLFLAKLPVGFMSGYLLQKYCPEEGEKNSKMMWLIIALSTVVSPVLLTVFWKYVSKKDDNEGDVGGIDENGDKIELEGLCSSKDDNDDDDDDGNKVSDRYIRAEKNEITESSGLVLVRRHTQNSGCSVSSKGVDDVEGVRIV